MKWEEVVNVLEHLKIPGVIVGIIFGLFFAFEAILWILEVKGKIVLEGANIKRQIQKKKLKKQEQEKLLQDVKNLLNDVNLHYSDDNIAKRNIWIGDVDTDRDWMHERAKIYDQSIIEIKNSLLEAANQLQANTLMTEDMFVENCRDRIMDFAEKAADDKAILSHEQFSRIFKVYELYENFLKEHNRTNGEIDTSYEMVQDGFKYRMKNHCFAEDIKGYQKSNTIQND